MFINNSKIYIILFLLGLENEAAQGVTSVGEFVSYDCVVRILNEHHISINRALQYFLLIETHTRRLGQRHEAISQRNYGFRRLNVLRNRTVASISVSNLIK